MYRRVQRKDYAVWQCAHRVSGRTDCTLYTLCEDDVCEVLLRAVNKLILHREQLLPPLITQLEAMQTKANGAKVKIYQVDQEIAALSRQSLVVAELLAQGILDPSDFTAQSNEIGRQISELRAKRRELLRQSETDDQLNELRELDDMLAGVEHELTEYDEDFIRAVVDHVTVQSETELKIHLHGGWTVTEFLPKYNNRRCKRK